jgi:hypothetical protein
LWLLHQFSEWRGLARRHGVVHGYFLRSEWQDTEQQNAHGEHGRPDNFGGVSCHIDPILLN